MPTAAALQSERVPAVLSTCKDCRFQRVTNTDFERLMVRNQRLQTLTGALGTSFGSHGPSPFVLFGTLLRFKRLQPGFVCSRCQGMRAETKMVVFCPECGLRTEDAVLLRCAKCNHDFRSDAEERELWRKDVPPLPVAPLAPARVPGGRVAAPMAVAALPAAVTVGTARGWGAPAPAAPSVPRCCDTCGRPFSALWRVVVDVQGARVERHVCGTGPQCRPLSLEPPILG